MMRLSPEFLRNLWLEMSVHRMLIMPVSLVLVFYIAYLMGEWSALHLTSLLIYIILTMLWGVRLAGESLIEEISNRTWDQQRMGAISPWQMSWGKLFGSTVYVWYGVLLTLPLFVVSGLISGEVMLWRKLLLLLSGAVLIQSSALLISLLMVRRHGSHRRNLSTLTLIAALFCISLASPFYDEYFNQLAWYGIEMGQLTFLTMSSVIFCGWALLGLQRTMAEELQFRNSPLVWLAFTLFLILYVMGFSPVNMENGLELNMIGVFLIALSLCYVMIFVERKDPLEMRRFQVARQQQGWYAALVHVPCWLVSLLIVLILGVVLQFVDAPLAGVLETLLSFDQLVLLLLLFLLRDIGVFIYFNLAQKHARADATAMVYLVLLYLLLPILFSVVGATTLNNLLVPITTSSVMLTALSGVVQCGVLGWLIYQRWLSFRK